MGRAIHGRARRASCTPTSDAKHHSLHATLSPQAASPFHVRCCTPGHATYVAVVLGASSRPCVVYVRWRLLCEGRRQQRWVAVPPATSFHTVPSAAILPLFSLSLFSFFKRCPSRPPRQHGPMSHMPYSCLICNDACKLNCSSVFESLSLQFAFMCSQPALPALSCACCYCIFWHGKCFWSSQFGQAMPEYHFTKAIKVNP